MHACRVTWLCKGLSEQQHPAQNGKRLLPRAGSHMPESRYDEDVFTDEEGEEALAQDEAESMDQKAKEEGDLRQCLQSVETEDRTA